MEKQIRLGNLPPGDVDDRSITDVDPAELAGYTQIHLFAGIGGIPYGLRLAGVPDSLNIITGGFPCQDISNAGQRAGITGARSGLWFRYAGIIRVLRPRYILVENVAALLDRGIDTVLSDLAASGYDAEWSVLSACAVGAPHTRERLFIVAYPNRQHGQARLGTIKDGAATLQEGDRRARTERWVHAVSGEDRSADGIPSRMDRIRGLGNAVSPHVVAVIGAAIRRREGI